MIQEIDIAKRYKGLLNSSELSGHNSNGRCYGMSLKWITDSLDGMISTAANRNQGFSLSALEDFYIYANMVQSTIHNGVGLETACKTLDSYHLLNGKTNKFNKAVIRYNLIRGMGISDKLDNLIKRPEGNAGEAILLITHDKGHAYESLHATALICDGKKVYYFNPNRGVFLMESHDNLQTILKHLKTNFHHDQCTSYGIASMLINLSDKSGIRPLDIVHSHNQWVI
ncbi:hypothetical protein A9B99_10980 [Mangrovibacter phragmitis]|uniref:Uncharacterized protein n=1 Tax=Mangrovibacter phragmitis TaxID=1691903 RepID=A0A1B7L0Z2_9ENTR|nr:hypothetical protein [Mangrovibacter phragmitis]OAT75977.1 hypothetical protein A9B99_10980 [Mangrovibacter phragmitis]